MAFVFDLPLDDTLSVKVTGLKNALEMTMHAPIGHDDETGAQYSVVASIITLQDKDYGEDATEVTFDVVECLDEKCFWYDNGERTKTFLYDTEHRARALEVVCYLVYDMISERQPASVHFTTKDANMPPKAMKKYDSLCRAIADAEA